MAWMDWIKGNTKGVMSDYGVLRDELVGLP